MTHNHVCICDNQWDCSLDILPAPGSRAWCKEWPDSLCNYCIDSICEHSVDVDRLAELLADIDPPAAFKCKKWGVDRESKFLSDR